jgi:hypothetical protein
VPLAAVDSTTKEQPPMDAPVLTISIIGILIALAIAWDGLGGKEDLNRLRAGWRDRR